MGDPHRMSACAYPRSQRFRGAGSLPVDGMRFGVEAPRFFRETGDKDTQIVILPRT